MYPPFGLRIAPFFDKPGVTRSCRGLTTTKYLQTARPLPPKQLKLWQLRVNFEDEWEEVWHLSARHQHHWTMEWTRKDFLSL
jgi:hypothetical protein